MEFKTSQIKVDRKNIEYKVIYSTDTYRDFAFRDHTALVNQEIQNGCEPLGGVSVSLTVNDARSITYLVSQAMIKG